MKLIPITDLNNKVVFINPEHVIFVEQIETLADDTTTKVYATNIQMIGHDNNIVTECNSRHIVKKLTNPMVV